ncbi:coiled-coil-helix-coiled-coil-helix domain-containing protein 7-like [Antedon mediterranea]|uniref:coiled-coil-helix-coiled-coil-helix domain-containing protein 7-like n=1 Tax=Antedon mediterranea TaxID=105859 RepID=UPI003AF9DA1F
METKSGSEIEADNIRRKRNSGSDRQKLDDINNNPCLEEANASYRCLHQNNFDRDSCTKYFLNYKNCRKFWGSLIRERKGKGLVPALPNKEERDKILENISVK